jgi:hypothetical protein
VKLLSALITLLVTAVAAYGGVKFMDSVGPDIAGSANAGSGTGKEVEAGSDESLLEPENFGKVLAAIRKEFGSEARIVNLRLEPSRLNVQVPQGTKSFVLQYNNEAEQTTKVETDVDLSDNPNVASITKVPAAAPRRIMKKIVKKTGKPIDNLSYMVITTFGPEGVGWFVSLKEGDETTWRAELNGRKVRAQ